MAQGEFFVERQNWARWPRVLKVNRVTDSGTETRRYVRKGADWEAKDYATRKIVELQTENAKLRELVVALYHVHFGTEEESWDAWEDFCPCSICEERHGGEAPCAYTSKDLADECCEPITKEIVIDRMRKLGVEV